MDRLGKPWRGVLRHATPTVRHPAAAGGSTQSGRIDAGTSRYGPTGEAVASSMGTGRDISRSHRVPDGHAVAAGCTLPLTSGAASNPEADGTGASSSGKATATRTDPTGHGWTKSQ